MFKGLLLRVYKPLTYKYTFNLWFFKGTVPGTSICVGCLGYIVTVMSSLCCSGWNQLFPSNLAHVFPTVPIQC